MDRLGPRVSYVVWSVSRYRRGSALRSAVRLSILGTMLVQNRLNLQEIKAQYSLHGNARETSRTHQCIAKCIAVVFRHPELGLIVE